MANLTTTNKLLERIADSLEDIATHAGDVSSRDHFLYNYRKDFYQQGAESFRLTSQQHNTLLAEPLPADAPHFLQFV